MNWHFLPHTCNLAISLTTLAMLASAQPVTRTTSSSSSRFVDAVDPFIGTGGNGHTYPGATVPFGMVQLGPDAGNIGWEWCSGYRYADSTLIGFSHTHLSGTGCADLGDILFTPTLSSRSLDDAYRSRFSHGHEKARPGYYSVVLLDHDITVELTATARAGMHRYTFPPSDSAQLIINLGYGQEDSPTDTYIRVLSDTLITGYRYSSGWAAHQKVFFAARFSRPARRIQLLSEVTLPHAADTLTGKRVKVILHFPQQQTNVVLAKVGISAVSIDGALRNCDTEIPHWDFDTIARQAAELWEHELSGVSIATYDEPTRRIFYTALYHTMLAPTLYNDIDGRYRGADGEIHTSQEFQNYSTFSLWDTYRSTHPLFTVLQPGRVNDMVKSMLAFHREGGLLPIWPLAGNETYCMIGYHSVPVIAEAYLKGIGDFSPHEALEAMKGSALGNRAGLQYYNMIPPQFNGTRGAPGAEHYVQQQWDVSGKVLSGYERSLSGESLAYRSSHDRARRALLSRATSGTMAVEWETSPVPLAVDDRYVTFVWLAGMASNKGGHRFDLFLQGEALVEFHTAAEPSEDIATFTGKDSVTLTFVPRMIDRFGDRFGMMALRVPGHLLEPGVPQTLRVVGEQAQSPDWYMTFEHALRETVYVSGAEGMVQKNGERFQFVRVETEHLGPPVGATVAVTGAQPIDTVVAMGHTIFHIPVSAVERALELPVTVTLQNGRKFSERVPLRPVHPYEYVPADREAESVSKTLEYAYDDWCIARLAKSLGREADAALFSRRAGFYRSLFDSTTGFMRGRDVDGGWVTPFNPRYGTAKQPEYTEGNAWQYTWSVQHDVQGLISLFGGKAQFSARLDSLFQQSSDLSGTGAPADVSGLIGQYAHGNEPSHHVAYLYTFVGEPWKTQELVGKICRTFYTAAPDGLIGNEDCGQMSAWYIFSALGMYPVDPVSRVYVLGSPLISQATLSLAGGNKFTVIARGASPDNVYVQSVRLNGVPLEKTYITHDDIVAGGTLVFTMGPRPNTRWGSGSNAAPPSMSSDHTSGR